MSGGGPRLPIPSSVRKTIQNIKEIARNHADDEIYAMLKECNWDPNETVQKLLQQDTFQEVRRKRDRRRENMNNKEAADSKWRPVTQGRGGKGVRGNYVSRHVSNDASGGKNSNSEKDNINNSDKDLLHISSETETKEPELLSPLTGMANGSINAKYENTFKKHASSAARPPGSVTKVGGRLPPVADKKNAVSETSRESGHISRKLAVPSSVVKLNSSAADPVLVPSLDSCAAAAVGTVKREIGTQQRSGENKHLYQDVPADDVPSSTETVPTDSGEHWIQGKAQTKSPNADRNQVIEASHSGSSSRPSSNYSTRSQQAILSQKGGPSKEWKPKPVNSNVQSSGQLATLDAPSVVEDPDSLSLLGSGSERSEGTGLKLQKKLENLHVSTEHVIIPHHLHVPEAERGAFSFGSFDVNFAVNAISINDPNGEKSSSLIPELSHEPDETAEEPSLGQDAVITPQERDYQDLELPSNIPDNLPTEEANSQSAISPESDYDQTKQDSMSFANPQSSAVQIAPGYSNLGLIPSVVGGQFAVPENSEPQLRDASRLTNFVVQQPFDFSSTYYAQMYRPGADGDGRFSPFLVSPGAASKYNGNIAVLAQQSGQSPQQENGNPMVLSTGGPTPLATQPTGVLQSSIALTQQPVPVFRQPAGVHISHYPPNYIPINQYFSPFYVPPPPPIHHFLSNAAFPQQPPAGSVYPSPVGGATAVKYSLPQYKSGNNAGNQTHIFPTGYGPYSSTAAGYGLNPAASTGNLTGSEDIGGSQYKDNGGFIAGQQSEGSNVWVPTPGRDPSGLPTSSFYNLPPQGQHMTFAPSQVGHSSFAGLYHPAQSVTAATAHPLLQQPQTVAGAGEMVGPPSGVYQQPQRAQINWGNSY